MSHRTAIQIPCIDFYLSESDTKSDIALFLVLTNDQRILPSDNIFKKKKKRHLMRRVFYSRIVCICCCCSNKVKCTCAHTYTDSVNDIVMSVWFKCTYSNWVNIFVVLYKYYNRRFKLKNFLIFYFFFF